jgi:hypothetical protein
MRWTHFLCRNCIFSGNQPFGIHNGLDGLMHGEIHPISWSEVTGWIAEVSPIPVKGATDGITMVKLASPIA